MYLGNLRMSTGLNIDKFGAINSPKLNFVPVETPCALSLLERHEFPGRPAEEVDYGTQAILSLDSVSALTDGLPLEYSRSAESSCSCDSFVRSNRR
jgi:hypothetical protein